MEDPTAKVRNLSLKLPVLLAAALFLASCASTRSTQQPDQFDYQLIARDLLYVMAQILEPDTTTFQLGRSATAFGWELEKGFREIGYGMQRVRADQGPRFMTYTESTNVSSSSIKTFQFKVFLGEIGLERHYTYLRGTELVPAGPMIVHGTRVSIALNEEIFPGQSSEVVYQDSDQTVLNDTLLTVFDASVAKTVGELRGTELPRYQTFNPQQTEIQNLFTRGNSNFESLERNYRVVRTEIIAFPDDSLFLLNKGRDQIQRIVKYYRPDTDLIRLVGCSNGPTKYKGGNIALAQGRSARIAQELVKRNVHRSTILDEGCWSSQSAGDRFPARGVVVELQRQS